MDLTMGEKTKILMDRRNITMIELGKRMETSDTNLHNQFKRDNFRMNTLDEIAETLGCKFVAYFVDEDGNKII